MNEKIAFCLSLLAIVTIASTVVVYAKSEVAGGYDTGFAVQRKLVQQ